MVDIKDMRDGMRKVEAEGVVTELSDERQVNLRAGGTARVRDVSLKDSSGSIALTIWDEQIDKVKEGSVVKVENGYTSTFKGVLHLQTGKYGSMKVDGQ
jgi:replication factor A1